MLPQMPLKVLYALTCAILVSEGIVAISFFERKQLGNRTPPQIHLPFKEVRKQATVMQLHSFTKLLLLVSHIDLEHSIASVRAGSQINTPCFLNIRKNLLADMMV